MMHERGVEGVVMEDQRGSDWFGSRVLGWMDGCIYVVNVYWI